MGSRNRLECSTTARWVVLAASLLAGCASVATPPPPTELPEVRPGYVAGYLQPNELPDSQKLLPPPPAPGSAAMAADESGYRAARKWHGTARWQLAARDAGLLFPAAAEHFSCALDMPISAEATPHLNMLLRRVRMDASRAADKAKEYYKRPRPFMVTGEDICTPHERSSLSRADSYPSGHTSIFWAWALVLTEAAPDRTDIILARGLSLGQSRVVCGVHWQSDIEGGRIMGAATVSRLHANPVFLAPLAEARKEIAAARAAGAKSPVNCAAEAKALELDR